MNLTNEKGYLLELAKEGVTTNSFKQINEKDTSYFVKYEESVHSSEVVEEYNSEDVIKIGNQLKELWEDSEKRKLIPMLMIALRKSSGDVPGRFRNIELNNYMM